jgi:hypothetical protein
VFRPDYEGTATADRAPTREPTYRFRPDHEGTIKQRVLSCGSRVINEIRQNNGN